MQFDIDVWYKLRKHHLISNALLRLSVLDSIIDSKLNIFDDLIKVNVMLVKALEILFTLKELENKKIFNVTLMKMTDELKDCLKQAYINNECWLKIWEMLSQINNSLITAYSDFCVCNDLIYLIDHDEQKWLMMSKALKKKVFKISHDSLNHQGFHWVFDKLTMSMYFNWNAVRQFQKYIEHCSACQLN